MLAMVTRLSCPNAVHLMAGPLILLVLFPFQKFAGWPFLCFLMVSQNFGNIISGDVCLISFQTRYCLIQVLTFRWVMSVFVSAGTNQR